jgi:hypothetical protein
VLATTAASYKAAVDAVRDHLLACITESPAGPVARKYRGDPGTYGGNFVAMTVSHVADLDGEGVHERPEFPPGFEFRVNFVDLALSRRAPTQPWVSNQEAAEARTEAAYSAFLDGLKADPLMGGQVREIRVSMTEAGSMDRLGNARQDINGDNILWTLSASVRVVL